MKKPIYGQPVIGIENKENDEELTITEMNNKSEIKCECELCATYLFVSLVLTEAHYMRIKRKHLRTRRMMNNEI